MLYIDKDMTELQRKQYDQLIQEKLDVVDERDQLVQQLEEDRLKYLIVISCDHCYCLCYLGNEKRMRYTLQ